MVEQQDRATDRATLEKAIAKATGIALVVALVILFTAVLPAEYGIDPLKTGALLHLTDLAKATAAKPDAKSEAIGRSSHARAGGHLYRSIEFLQSG